MDREGVGAISRDGLKDGIGGGLGPDERLRVVVVGLDHAPKFSRATARRTEEARRPKTYAGEIKASVLSADALDDRITIVGTAGSGKTYAAKGFVERLLEAGARVTVVDPLGVWWGLRASADGAAPGYPLVVFGGRQCRRGDYC
jgi:hypothetical protein